MFLVSTTGAILSSTVTIAISVAIFPLTSVTFNVTVFAPTVAQVKSVLSKVIVAMPQASVEPLFTSDATIETVPAALS